LPENEAAIEFVSFRDYHYKEEVIKYCALIVKRNASHPELIPLFEENQLDSLITNSVDTMYSYRADWDFEGFRYGERLYNLIWKPLEKSLAGIKTIYYSPAGKLNQIAFAAIPIDTAKTLTDKYDLRQVTSTKEILKKRTPDNEIKSAALFGGIKYEIKDSLELKSALSLANPDIATRSGGIEQGNSGGFKELPGSKREVEGIRTVLNDKGISIRIYDSIQANEKNFKELSGKRKDIIHIATHGFYIPKTDADREGLKYLFFGRENKSVVVENPLLRSGLALAGANKAWRGDTVPDNCENGLLTSYEISQMNLFGTKLVVLSACGTGLGDINGSQGVYGLQRAFKIAGVETIIMSLWKVPDEATSKLMQLFYKFWITDQSDIHTAFHQAQNEIRKMKEYSNIKSWAGFVIID